jgi:hypothetical protein
MKPSGVILSGELKTEGRLSKSAQMLGDNPASLNCAITEFGILSLECIC